MRVLLVQPPVEDFYITSQRLQPTGLLYLASFLRRQGHEVEILDLLYPLKRTRIPLDDELAYLEGIFKSRRIPDLFRRYCRFGALPDAAARLIGSRTFDVCGVSANFSAYYRTSLEICGMVRSIRPSAFVVVGGNSAPVCFRTYLESGSVDAVVFGEGEKTMLDLLSCRSKGERMESVPNIAFLRDGVVRETPRAGNFDIESSSLDLDFVDPDHYRIGRRRVLSMVTSRGCPARCGYCTANLNCLSGHQRRSLDSAWNEVGRNVEKHGIEALNIEDENFTVDRDYSLEFLERKAEIFPGLRLFFMNGLDYRTLDDGLLAGLRKADLLNLGLALVDAENTDLINRPASVEKFRSVVSRAKELGFRVTAYFIAGLPGQTRESLDRLVALLSGLGVVVGMSPYYAVPGTDIFERGKARFEGLKFGQMRSTALISATDGVTPGDMLDLLDKVRGLNLGLRV